MARRKLAACQGETVLCERMFFSKCDQFLASLHKTAGERIAQNLRLSPIDHAEQTVRDEKICEPLAEHHTRNGSHYPIHHRTGVANEAANLDAHGFGGDRF